MFAGIGGNGIGDIDVEYFDDSGYVRAYFWEPGHTGHVSIELPVEKARELMEKLQAALPVSSEEEVRQDRQNNWPDIEQPIVPAQAQPYDPDIREELGRALRNEQPIVTAQAQPDLETDLPAPVAVDDIPW